MLETFSLMRNRQIVLTEIQNAVADERKSQLRVLHLLREVENDGHYLELGFPSLFEFATRYLGYSAGAAHRRMQSMRLLKVLPQMEAQIEDGRLSLCVAAKTQSFFRAEDQKRKGEGEEKLSVQAKQEITQSMLGRSMRECERKLAEISPTLAFPPEKARELALGKTLIQFSASEELMEKLERLKGMLAHRNPDGSYEGLFEVLAEIVLKKVATKYAEAKKAEPQREAAVKVATPKTSADDANPPTHTNDGKKEASRYIPAEVKRRVYARDGGQCTYEDSQTGRRCESQFALQFDHAQPYAWGGPTCESNLRLRCRAHNAYTARKQGLTRSPWI